MSSKHSAYTLWFDEIDKDDIPLVGGKNANLGEMYQHLTHARSAMFPDEQIQVPYGFAVTASAYQQFVIHNGLNEKIKNILNGLDTRNMEDLEVRGHNARRAILNGVFPADVERDVQSAYRALAEKLKLPLASLDVAVRSSTTAEDLPDASFAGQQETYLNVCGEKELMESIKKAFASLFTNRAISYRVDKSFDHFTVALSVAVQKMARADKGCAGVMFTLDTESGFRDVVLINGSWGLGELVVKGVVTPDEFKVFKPTLQKGFNALINKKLGSKEKKLIYAIDGTATTKEVLVSNSDRQSYVLNDEYVLKLSKWGMLIEEHYQKPMDIEWVYDGQQLFIVQARPETVETQKHGRILEEYVMMEKGTMLTQGAAVGAKIGHGKAHLIHDTTQIGEFRAGEVLVTEITDPDWEPIMKIAAAIVTNAGGRTSHAAIISRELGIPAIVGCGNATTMIRDGQDITVSCAEGEVGKVYEGLLQYHVDEHDLSNVVIPTTEIKMIAADPEMIFRYSFLPHKGIGLAREEFIISNFVKIHPNALIHFDRLPDGEIKNEIERLTAGYTDKQQYYVEKLSYGIAQLAAACYPYNVLLRFSDFKSNEYANLIGGTLFEPHEENPMIGWRGASRYYDEAFQAAFALECDAVKKVRNEMGLWNVSVMVPFCRTPEEGKKVLEELARHGLAARRIPPELRKTKKSEDLMEELEVWVMAEIPSNILQVEEFAELFDGFSIGSNDLTQLTLGLDRDSKMIAHVGNEKNKSVLKLIHMLITEAHARGLKVGICGQGPSDFPDFAEFLVREGIDSISINPDTVLKATVNIKAMEDRLR